MGRKFIFRSHHRHHFLTFYLRDFNLFLSLFFFIFLSISFASHLQCAFGWRNHQPRERMREMIKINIKSRSTTSMRKKIICTSFERESLLMTSHFHSVSLLIHSSFWLTSRHSSNCFSSNSSVALKAATRTLNSFKLSKAPLFHLSAPNAFALFEDTWKLIFLERSPK